MAGLVGARPRGPGKVTVEATASIPLGLAPSTRGPAELKLPVRPSEAIAFPYSGVDPYCEIVPISTSFDPDPEQLIMAMLYADAIDADIIVVARDFPDPLNTAITGRPGAVLGAIPEDESYVLQGAYPIDDPSAEELGLWAALRSLTVAISATRPIVCAVGNGGDRATILPAALAHPNNGVIAVGARAATRQPASYTTVGVLADGSSAVTLYAPSGDGERLDRALQRIDTLSTDFRRSDHSSAYLPGVGVNFAGSGEQANPVTASTFATQEIVSTDVPGGAGYNSSAFGPVADANDRILDYRSYFCHFSGTSAATAIAAGMLSLAISAGKIERGNGPEAKRRLRGGNDPTDDAAGTPALSWPATVAVS